MYLGAICQAIGLAGGSIAWHIGHHDFAPPNQTSRYMAVHVTLNGARGLLAPLISVTGYHALQAAGCEASTLMLVICCGACVIGASGFVLLRLAMGGERLKISRTH
jgi:hypothetical protein